MEPLAETRGRSERHRGVAPASRPPSDRETGPHALAADGTAFLESLVDAFVPWKQGALHALDAAERRVVVGEVAEFLTAQFAALPRRLRFLLAVGLAGFRSLVRLRHPGGFRALPWARRAALVEWWAFGGLPPARTLFRPIRSMALLAFFDHPRVHEALGVAEERAPVRPVRGGPGRARLPDRAEVLVVGSGAGGSVTALELAERGHEVVVLEEGPRLDLSSYGESSTRAMAALYRHRGMTPILGRLPIGYVEGCCVGGSTEINSGFWHRVPPETLLRWQSQYDLVDASVSDLAAHFEWAEGLVGVGPHPTSWTEGTKVLARGAELMGWAAEEVPRMARGCRSTNACASGCPTGAKQGMSRSLLPRAETLGVRVFDRARVRRFEVEAGRVARVVVDVSGADGSDETVSVAASHVFVCAGPTQTPALLRRSGLRRHVGDSLRIHPMLKVVARFPERIDAHRAVLPLIQVKQFAPDITLGGAFFSPGHAAMALSENWRENRAALEDVRRLGAYYVAVRGAGKGRVRWSWVDDDVAVSHDLCDVDVWNLSKGFARLCLLLLAAGAEEIFPAIQGLAPIRKEIDAVRWLDDPLPRSALALTAVHAFSSCPMGERDARCAVDSFGRVRGVENLWVNDASMLPDSPGVNPQATIMAFARRNAIHFDESSR